MAGGAQAKMSTWFSKPNQSLISKVTKKKGRIQPEKFCVCAPENCPLQGGAEITSVNMAIICFTIAVDRYALLNIS